MPRFAAPGHPGILLPDGYQVLLDGADVTNVARAADTDEGWVDVYPHTYLDGRLHLSSEEPVRRRGKIEIRREPVKE